MIDFRVLGPPRISASDGRSVELLVRQPKRTALLAYLAAARPRGPHRRDRLLALFWPESDDARARAALSQALYVLRSALGVDAIVSRGDDEVELDRDVVRCDVVAFEAALDAGRPDEALALYGGDLLDGFFISDAPEFERWLDGERERLRHRAAEGAWALAGVMAAGGDAAAAVRWARWAAGLLPGDEAVARRLMTFLDGLGDRAAAIRAYEAFAWRLSQEYELAPSAETERLAAAIRHGDPGATVIGATKGPTPAGESGSRLPAAPAPVPEERSVRRRAPAAIGVVAVIAVVLWGIASSLRWLGSPPSAPPPVARFTLDFAGVPPLASGIGGATIALSPDGSHLVYLGAGEQGPQLYIRPMDRLEAAAVPHTRGARMPFFSPDGEWLGFVMGNEIRKAPVRGGPAITVATVTTNVPGASWGPDERIVFATPAGLWQTQAEGGEPALLAVSDTLRGERFRWPSVLPDGRAAVFTRADSSGFHLAAVSLERGTVVPLGLDGTSPRFVSAGYLVFARPDGALLAAPFDPHRLRITGSAMPLAEGVMVGIAGEAKLGISNRGALAYVPEASRRELVLVARGGRTRVVPVPPQRFATPRFSPDGRRIAVAVAPTGGELPDIWIVDPGSGTSHRVTFDRGSVSPVWSPDGARIASAAKPGGRAFGFALRWTTDAGDSIETLLPGDVDQLPAAFAPDGGALVFQRRSAGTGGDLWILPLDGERNPRPYLRGPAHEVAAAVSPDGRWLAYASDESGREELYVRAFPHPGPPVQISSGGGREPRWAASGRELFYRGPAGLSAVAVRSGSALSVGTREVLFDDGPYQVELHAAGYDVSPDAQQFVMVRRGPKDHEVVIVLNGLDWLRRHR